MFIRVKTSPNTGKRSVQIVESYRKGSQVTQKIIRHVGMAMDDQEEQKLRDLGTEIMAKLQKEQVEQSSQMNLFDSPTENEIKQHLAKKPGRPKKKRLEEVTPPDQVTLDEIVEKTRVVEGVHEVAGPLYDQLYGGLLKGKRPARILKDLVLTRLVTPGSKRQSQKRLLNQFHIDHDLDAIYRVMDQVAVRIDQIKQSTFARTQGLFPQGVDLLLFDVTTLYFESTTTDELRQYGYSKDHRFNTTQLVLALATNAEGLPVGYELFEGNKAEVKTLIEAIENWKQLFDIGQVCFVGDRAMMSKANLRLLEAQGYHYIIAAKLRSLPAALQDTILNSDGYRPTVMNDELTWVGEFAYEGRRLITSYRQKRAWKDQQERQRVLDKIEKRLAGQPDTKKLITNRGVKKYTKTTASETTLDPDKIDSEAQWDGMHGILTNIHDDQQTPEALLARYAQLWKIEESFRINKHTLKMRPIFHWKPERIRAHIAICYMAFALLRNIQYTVELRQKISADTIIDELLGVQSSIYMHKTTRDLYRVPGAFSQTAKKIYKAFDLERSLDASVYLP